MQRTPIDRRRFLGNTCGLATAGLATAATVNSLSQAEELPPITNPRATSGDDRHEPDWQNRFTFTVGPVKADIVGDTDKAIQAAVDYVVRNNEVIGSGKVGVLFRDDSRGKDFWPNRNMIDRNRIIDSGADDGIAIDIQGRTKDIAITGNEIRETRQPAQRIGIRLGPETHDIEQTDNVIVGFETAVQNLNA